MTPQQLHTIGLDENATEEEIQTRLTEFAAPRKTPGTVNGLAIPPELDTERVNARFKALVEAGTSAELAGRFAIEAENNQRQRDLQNGGTYPAN